MNLTIFKTNPLVVWAACLVVTYWLFAAILPGWWINSFVSSALTIAAITIFSTAVGEATRIMRQGVIGPGQLAVLGITVIALGSFYSGVFGILWAVNGYPKAWVGTAISSYGKALNVFGYGLLYVSPGASVKGIKRPNLWVIIGAVFLVAGMAFYMGTQFPEK